MLTPAEIGRSHELSRMHVLQSFMWTWEQFQTLHITHNAVQHQYHSNRSSSPHITMVYDESLSLSSHIEQRLRDVSTCCSWLVSKTLIDSFKLDHHLSCESWPFSVTNRQAQILIVKSIIATRDMERALQKRMADLRNKVCISYPLALVRADVVFST